MYGIAILIITMNYENLTKRLILRPIDIKDASDLFLIRKCEEVQKYMYE
jgi:hypothetical protein